MTSTRHELRDLAHRLVYLVGPLVGASDDGGDHGGAAERNDGETLALAVIALSRVWPSVYKLLRS